MSRGKTKQLLNLLDEANIIIDILYRENKELKKKNRELEANKSKGIIKRLAGLFS